MKLIKIEKNFCRGCVEVGAFLDDAGATYDTWNINTQTKEAEEARAILQELGLFTVPVTILMDGDKKVLDHVAGMDENKLKELVSQAAS